MQVENLLNNEDRVVTAENIYSDNSRCWILRLGDAVDYHRIVEVDGEIVKVTHTSGDSFRFVVWGM